MTIIRVRLDADDCKRYGGEGGPLPDELVLDVEQIKDLPAGELDEVEREMDVALAAVVPQMEGSLPRASFVRRVVAYLAVRQAGGRPSWEDFQPRLLRAHFTQEEIPRPPAGPSEGSSEV